MEAAGAKAYICGEEASDFDYRKLVLALQQQHTDLDHIIVRGNAEEFVPFHSLFGTGFALPQDPAMPDSLLCFLLSGGTTSE